MLEGYLNCGSRIVGDGSRFAITQNSICKTLQVFFSWPFFTWHLFFKTDFCKSLICFMTAKDNLHNHLERITIWLYRLY